jgi:hypothetical protein
MESGWLAHKAPALPHRPHSTRHLGSFEPTSRAQSQAATSTAYTLSTMSGTKSKMHDASTKTNQKARCENGWGNSPKASCTTLKSSMSWCHITQNMCPLPGAQQSFSLSYVLRRLDSCLRTASDGRVALSKPRRIVGGAEQSLREIERAFATRPDSG